MSLLPPKLWDEDPNRTNMGWPVAVVFKRRHLLTWFCYLAFLWLSWRLLAAYRPVGDFTIAFGVMAMGVYLVTLMAWENQVHAWLDGARRYMALRWLLFATALANIVLPLLMLPLLLRLVAGGVASLWVKPGVFELFSLGVFLVTTGMALVAVIGVFVHVWIFSVLAWRLLMGRLPERPPDPFAPRSWQPKTQAESPSLAAATPTPEPPRSRWHDERPAVLSPGRLQEFVFRPLRAYSFSPPSQEAARERIRQCCAKLDWPVLEWVFRTRPSWQEECEALRVVPNLASSVDETDAASIRGWLVRYSQDARQFEINVIPREDYGPEAWVERVRMAEVGREALKFWDEERANPSLPAREHRPSGKH